MGGVARRPRRSTADGLARRPLRRAAVALRAGSGRRPRRGHRRHRGRRARRRDPRAERRRPARRRRAARCDAPRRRCAGGVGVGLRHRSHRRCRRQLCRSDRRCRRDRRCRHPVAVAPGKRVGRVGRPALLSRRAAVPHRCRGRRPPRRRGAGGRADPALHRRRRGPGRALRHAARRSPPLARRHWHRRSTDDRGRGAGDLRAARVDTVQGSGRAAMSKPSCARAAATPVPSPPPAACSTSPSSPAAARRWPASRSPPRPVAMPRRCTGWRCPAAAPSRSRPGGATVRPAPGTSGASPHRHRVPTVPTDLDAAKERLCAEIDRRADRARGGRPTTSGSTPSSTSRSTTPTTC